MKARGFTLIELVLVISVIGILTVLAVPGYQAIVFRARAAEARMMLSAIANAELAYYRDHGQYLAAAPSTSTGGVPKAPVAFDTSRPSWKQLGVRAEGLVRYRYSVVLAAGTFKAVAEGDLDADGQASSFELDGATLAISVRDELE